MPTCILQIWKYKAALVLPPTAALKTFVSDASKSHTHELGMVSLAYSAFGVCVEIQVVEYSWKRPDQDMLLWYMQALKHFWKLNYCSFVHILCYY